MIDRGGRVWQDVRVAARFLRRRPAATAVAVLTLGIAVAVCATAVGLLDQALWREARGADGGRLVTIYSARPSAPHFQVLSWPDCQALRTRLADRVALAAFVRVPSTIGGGDTPVRVTGELVSDNYFAVLGGRPLAGRLLDASAPPTSAVLAYELWRHRFNARPDIVGTTVTLGRDSYTVVGVASEGFRDPAYDAQFWIPATSAPRVFGQDFLVRADVPLFQTVGRLEPEATLEQLRGLVRGLPTSASTDGWTLMALPGSHLRFWPAYREAVARFLRIFVALGACILLLAAVNLAGLLLARSGERGREMAVRQALGASRRDLIRRLAAEGALLTAGGATLGLIALAWATTLLQQVPLPVPAPLTLTFDLRTAASVVVLSLVAAALFCGLSALRGLALDPRRSLVQRGTGGAPQTAAANLLVVAQIGLCSLLLVVCGLLARSAANIGAVDSGLSESNQVLALVALQDQRYDDERVLAFYDRLLASLRQRPEVGAASLGWHVPLTRLRVARTYTVGAGPAFTARQNVVSPEYFGTLQIPLLRGREFTPTDTAAGEPVAIVNETLARNAGGDVLGRMLRDTRGGPPRRIVGVVHEIKYNGITEPPQPFVYLPLAQAVRSDMHVHVRTRAAGVAAIIPRAVHALDTSVAVSEPTTFGAVRREAEAVPRASAQVAAAAAALAVFLAVVGLYGVLTASVERRRRELAIRAALGATPGEIVRRVVSEGAALTAAGLAAGWLAGLGSGRLVSDLLYGVARQDPLVFATVPLLVCTVSALAWIAPARRAAGVDPASVLRGE